MYGKRKIIRREMEFNFKYGEDSWGFRVESRGRDRWMESDLGDSEGGGFWFNWFERIFVKDRLRIEIKGFGFEG